MMQAETAVSTATSRGFAPTADAMIRAHLAKTLSREDLVLVHVYFIRNATIDPLRAHGIIKALHACGQEAFPSMWRTRGFFFFGATEQKQASQGFKAH